MVSILIYKNIYYLKSLLEVDLFELLLFSSYINLHNTL